MRWTAGGRRVQDPEARRHALAGDAVAAVPELSGGGCGSSKAAGTAQPHQGQAAGDGIATAVIESKAADGKVAAGQPASSEATKGEAGPKNQAAPQAAQAGSGSASTEAPAWIEPIMGKMVSDAVAGYEKSLSS